MTATGLRSLRLVLGVALASGITWSICKTVGLGSAAPYGVVIAALLLRPDFRPWPRPLLVLLPLLVLVGLGLGTFLKPLIEGPQVWQFAVITVIAQCLAQALPDKLMAVRNLLAVLAVLPLLGSNATWLSAWHQLLAVLVGMLVSSLLLALLQLPIDLAPHGPAEPAPPQAEAGSPAQAGAGRSAVAAAKPAAAEPMAPPSRSLALRFADPFFWRKLAISTLALSIGMGVGAVTPKYLYFGVVLLLNDSLGATLARVRDRMLGVSFGVLMPLLVFNTFPLNAIAVALVMGGTAALLPALGLTAQLRTALITSGVTFVGYGPLQQWYVPNRWLDYLMGCGLALLVCLLVRPYSALQEFRRLAAAGPGRTPRLDALIPSALEEARLLGQEPEFRELLRRLDAARPS